MSLFSFFKKDFVKNVMILITGSGISQVILYLSILWLTRLFSTEVFGVYMLFSSAILVLKPITSLQIELAILLPKKDKNAINIVVLNLCILFILNLILFGIILTFKTGLISFFEIKKLTNFIYLIPVASFFFGCTIILNYWNNRQKSFASIAKGNIVKSSVLSASQITTGLSSFSYLGMIPGMILGQLTQVIYLFITSFKSFKNLKQHITVNRMFFLLKKYKDIPLYNTLLNFSNTLSNEIPVLLISKFFGFNLAGIYGLAIKIGRAPAGVFQGAIGQVFFNKATETYNIKGNMQAVIKKTAIHLFKISFGFFTLLLILSFFLDLILGKNWIDVGLYLRILIPWLFVMFITSPLTSLITILNKQKMILLYDIILLLSRFIAFYVGYYIFNSFVVALSLFSAVGFIFNTLIFLYLNKVSKNYTQEKNSY